MKSRSQKKKSKNPRGGVPSRITHPPPIANVHPGMRFRRRFIANANFDNNISWSNILDSFLIAGTATQGYKAFGTCKIHEVEVWHCPMASTVSTVAVEFAGLNAGMVGDQRSHSDSSMGTSPAHVRARPPKGSQASQWQYDSATTVFRLTAPSGSVIDVEFSLRGELNSAITVANALVGATAGAFYFRGLDGQPIASTVLVPAVPTAWAR